MIHRLFIYGTLAPGRTNEHVLADVPGVWEPATVTGILLEEGWGAEAGYPGIVLDRNGSEVHGFLFSSEVLPQHWARLDDFEGEGYKRMRTTVRTESGENVESYIYVLRRERLPYSS